MLDRIAGYLRKEIETRNKVRAAMAYPSVMLVMAIGVTIFLLTYAAVQIPLGVLLDRLGARRVTAALFALPDLLRALA